MEELSFNPKFDTLDVHLLFSNVFYESGLELTKKRILAHFQNAAYIAWQRSHIDFSLRMQVVSGRPQETYHEEPLMVKELASLGRVHATLEKGLKYLDNLAIDLSDPKEQRVNRQIGNLDWYSMTVMGIAEQDAISLVEKTCRDKGIENDWTAQGQVIHIPSNRSEVYRLTVDLAMPLLIALCPFGLESQRISEEFSEESVTHGLNKLLSFTLVERL